MLKTIPVSALSALLIAGSVLGSPRVHAAPAAASVQLRYHFTVGQKFGDVETTTSVTGITAKVGTGSQAQPLVQKSSETDKISVMATVQKVNADGSAVVRIDYSNGTMTKDGKTTTLPLGKFYRVFTISADGKQIADHSFNAASLTADQLSAVPSSRPTKYPSAPIAIGGTWVDSETQAGIGTLTATYRLVALGSQNGRQTASVQISANQKLAFTQSGLAFNGTVTGGGTAQFFVDTGIVTAPSSISLHLGGTISGNTSGLPVKGTFAFSILTSSSPS